MNNYKKETPKIVESVYELHYSTFFNFKKKFKVTHYDKGGIINIPKIFRKIAFWDIIFDRYVYVYRNGNCVFNWPARQLCKNNNAKGLRFN